MQSMFVWTDHIREILWTSFLSMVPMFEGRYALGIMIGMGMPVVFAFFLAAICSSIPVPIVLWLFKPVVQWIYTLPISWLRKFASWVENHSEQKAKKMSTLGLWGLFVFVAIPLPGTGGWTGSVISTIFNMNRPKSLLAIVLGNFAACAITTAIMIVGMQAAGKSIVFF